MKIISHISLFCCFVLYHVKADAIALALSDPRARPHAIVRPEPDATAWPYVLPLPSALPFPDGEKNADSKDSGDGPLSLMVNLLGIDLGSLLDPIVDLVNSLLEELGLRRKR